MRNRLPLFLVKILYYEYWPFWLFFMPLVPWWIYLSIRSRSLTYFTAANPSIPHGGVFGESKSEILDLIPEHFKPLSIYIKSIEDRECVEDLIQQNGLKFPLIAKPDVGERGSKVEKIKDVSELKLYLSKSKEEVIIQEYIDYPIELGVLYYRMPLSKKSGISSIVMKEFLSIKGDGKSTIGELLKSNERLRLQEDALKEKYASQMSEVLGINEELELQPIGNHCLGTKFLSGQHLINDNLIAVFDEISSNIEGFDHGRFDLKVRSLEGLQQGNSIKIMELNGVTSEPGHIYDPSFNIFKAYRDTMFNMKITSDISLENRKLGVEVTPFWKMLRLIREHFSSSKELKTANDH